MASTPALTYAQLCKDISSNHLSPVYLIHGEEGYYADELVKQFEAIIPADAQDFDLYSLYAKDTSPDMLNATCRRYPMFGSRVVVVLKEAQSVSADELNKYASYVSNPSDTTVLAIVCRGAQAKGKDLIAAIKNCGGAIFESKKLNERNIDSAIEGLVKSQGLNIEPKGMEMLRDHIGLDMAKMHSEITKLAMILGKGATITPESIERNVGISKDYNSFELVDAIAIKNASKALEIVNYFRNNPKNNPTVLITAAIFNFFSQLLIAQFTRDKSPSSLMKALGLKYEFQLRKFNAAMRCYNAYMSIEIISAIRDFDAKTKGMGSRQNEYTLLEELVFKILYAKGNISF